MKSFSGEDEDLSASLSERSLGSGDRSALCLAYSTNRSCALYVSGSSCHRNQHRVECVLRPVFGAHAYDKRFSGIGQ